MTEMAVGAHTQDTVLDPFAGSGTTLMAAEATGRRAALLELDPRYCDVIVRRWQEATGGTAVLDGEDRSFAEVATERLGATIATSESHEIQSSTRRGKRHAAVA